MMDSNIISTRELLNYLGRPIWICNKDDHTQGHWTIVMRAKRACKDVPEGLQDSLGFLIWRDSSLIGLPDSQIIYMTQEPQ